MESTLFAVKITRTVVCYIISRNFIVIGSTTVRWVNTNFWAMIGA